jgi:antitoxin component of MazEF toxin-antitoxin module
VILSLRKPESQVEQEIDQIKAQVEQDYLQRLEAEKSAAVAKEVQSLLAADLRKKQQAELDAKAVKEAAEYARVEAEVLQTLGLGKK